RAARVPPAAHRAVLRHRGRRAHLHRARRSDDGRDLVRRMSDAGEPGGGSRALPRWARFMDDAEWARFLVAVEAELIKRRFRYRIDDGYVWAPWGGDEDEALSLLNLAQLCHAAGPEQFAQVIVGHFDALVAGRKDRVLADELGANLELARPHLKLRLYPRETF